MAQTNYTPIQLYYSTTAAAVPVNTNLVSGELAINITDEKLYFKNAAGTVKLLASNATSAPVLSFQTSLSGLTPSTATTGVVTLAGTLGVASGGTGLTTLATGSLSYGAGTSAFSALAIGTAGQILTVNSGATAPQWSTLSGVAVTTFSAGTTGFTPSSATSGAVTLAGTLATTNGGTGLTSFTSGGVVFASSTSALATGSTLTFVGATLTSSNIKVGTGVASNSSRLMVNTPNGSGAGIQLFQDGQESWTMENIASGTALRWLASSSELMRLNSTGLGIGTSSPFTRLEVNSGSGTAPVLSVYATNPAYGAGDVLSTIGFGANASGNNIQSASISGLNETASSSTNGILRFSTRTAGSVTEKMRITSAGNLGLGTNAPGNAAGYSTFSVNGSSGGQITFQTAQAEKAYIYNDSTDLYLGTVNGGGAVRLYAGSATERARIDSSGTFIIKNDYQEQTFTANSSTAITLNIVTNGTDQVITLTGTATITMPTATAGKSFLLKLKTGAGGYTVTWSTVKWPSGTAPTLTSTASRMDIFSFFSDGTNWYGCTVGQNYTP